MPRAAMSVATMKRSSPRFTLRHHPLALLLRQVAVEQLGVVAVAVQHRGDEAGVAAGVAEHDGRLAAPPSRSCRGGCAASGTSSTVWKKTLWMLSTRNSSPESRIVSGSVRYVVDELLDVGRHRGREQELLAAVGQVVEDPGHLLEEAHVEHLVRLVEAARPWTSPRSQRAAPDVVVDAARRADHDLGPVLQLVELVAHATRRRRRRPPTRSLCLPERGDLVGHLQRQLPRRAHHQRGGAAAPGRDALQHGDAEGGGLPGPGLRADDDVPPVEDGPEGGRPARASGACSRARRRRAATASERWRSSKEPSAT